MLVKNIHEAKTHLSQLIKQVIAGEEVVIAKAGQPLVKLVAYQKPKAARKPDVLKGKIEVVGDLHDADPLIESWFHGDVNENTAR